MNNYFRGSSTEKGLRNSGVKPEERKTVAVQIPSLQSPEHRIFLDVTV
jgi:hypothetical protein